MWLPGVNVLRWQVAVILLPVMTREKAWEVWRVQTFLSFYLNLKNTAEPLLSWDTGRAVDSVGYRSVLSCDWKFCLVLTTRMHTRAPHAYFTTLLNHASGRNIWMNFHTQRYRTAWVIACCKVCCVSDCKGVFFFLFCHPNKIFCWKLCHNRAFCLQHFYTALLELDFRPKLCEVALAPVSCWHHGFSQ